MLRIPAQRAMLLASLFEEGADTVSLQGSLEGLGFSVNEAEEIISRALPFGEGEEFDRFLAALREYAVLIP